MAIKWYNKKMEEYEKLESEALKKIASGSPKMKISGKSAFLLSSVLGKKSKDNPKIKNE